MYLKNLHFPIKSYNTFALLSTKFFLQEVTKITTLYASVYGLRAYGVSCIIKIPVKLKTPKGFWQVVDVILIGVFHVDSFLILVLRKQKLNPLLHGSGFCFLAMNI